MTSEEKYDLINAARDLMLPPAQELLPKQDFEYLPGIIRITEVFNAEVCEDPPILGAHDALYNCNTILIVVDFFLSLRDSYRLISRTKLTQWPQMTQTQVIDEFKIRHTAYHKETDFEPKLGLLLDLFKLQIIWAALVYD